MSKLAAVLVSTLVIFVLSVSWLPSGFAPLINWLGPELGSSFMIMLALVFFAFGSPLTYTVIFTAWAITGTVVGLFARGLRPAIAAASLVYTMVYALLAVSFLGVFLNLNKSGLLNGNLPPVPPGTNIASILNAPVFSQFAPLFLNSISSASSGSSALGSFNVSSLITSILPSLIGGAVILFVFAAIVGFFLGRVSKMLKPSKRKSVKQTAAPSSPEPVPVSVKTAAIVILAILALSAGMSFYTNASSENYNYYYENTISLVGTDGSATNYYAFAVDPNTLSGRGGYFAGLLSQLYTFPSFDAAFIGSQNQSLSFLPSNIVSALAKYVSLVPPTLEVYVASTDCGSAQPFASAFDTILSNIGYISGSSLLTAIPIDAGQVGGSSGSQACVVLYGSNQSPSKLASTFVKDTLPSFSSTGLIKIFENGLSTGNYTVGATPNSVNASAIFAGVATPQFLSLLPGIGTTLSQSAEQNGQTFVAIAGGVTERNGVAHSSSNEHTVTFADLMQYYQQVSLAANSSFSLAGIGVPLASVNSSSPTSLSDYNYTMITTNATLLAQVIGTGQAIMNLSPGSSVSTAIQAIFTRLLPANIHVTKTMQAQNDGTVLVTINVQNSDNDSLTNLVMNDTGFQNAYPGSLQVTSGNALDSSVLSLGPNQSHTYTYSVKVSGIGIYVGGSAFLSYNMNGTKFTTFSNSAYYSAASPGAIASVQSLAGSIGSVLDQYAGLGSSGTSIVYIAMIALLAGAAFMEFRSFNKWRKG
ncbi:MAG: hypothetical protein ACYCQJ_02270 [Nitrososphaerales archaeon]